MSAGISVIITCFNLERYIGEAIHSVLSQEVKSPVEIVVVDDSSTDGSPQVIQSLPVRYLRTNENSGVLLAMLMGIEAATGDVICFLDGDDLWEPGKLAAVIEAFDQDPRLAFVTHDLSYMDAEGRPIDRPSRPSAVLGPMDREEAGEKVRQGILTQDDFVWLGSAFSVRRSLSRVGEFSRWARSLPDPQNTYQDWPLAFWIASRPDVMLAYLPQKLFRYRLHQANYSGDASTASNAVRNLTRTRNTLAAMHQLTIENGLAAYIRHGLARRKQAYEYLILLYQGRAAAALTMFPNVFTHFLSQRMLGKELIRLAGILLVGPDRFARWAAKRSAA